ncbi:hypothetical protein [Paenibacillus etheri]|uniref:Uncharacterized protein n=1 Tax=Paenibacillus etheri TaxID=1306852 RepID=A0A0W1AY16_9BACL|nr:hypothetical protein [Paenibacillus etheri]KTD86216.1 hypothetical protein UQ64_17315 [Paenibacillus etheri]
MNNKSLYRSIVLALCLTFVTSYSGSMISATKAKFEAMISVGIFDGVSDTRQLRAVQGREDGQYQVLQFDDPSKMPKIEGSGLTTLYRNSVKNDEKNPILDTATESLVTKPKPTTSLTSEPAKNPNPND